jgi:hypothetical protein
MKEKLKKIYTKEYAIFLVIGFMPLIYKICQIAFLSSFADAMKIIGQMTCGVWVITLDSLIGVFSAGMIFSSLYTISVYIFEKIKSKKTRHST